MKRFIAAVTFSTALAVGMTSCAHQQLSKARLAEGAATAAVIAGLVILAASTQCENCNIAIDGPQQAALPPR